MKYECAYIAVTFDETIVRVRLILRIDNHANKRAIDVFRQFAVDNEIPYLALKRALAGSLRSRVVVRL